MISTPSRREQEVKATFDKFKEMMTSIATSAGNEPPQDIEVWEDVKRVTKDISKDQGYEVVFKERLKIIEKEIEKLTTQRW